MELALYTLACTVNADVVSLIIILCNFSMKYKTEIIRIKKKILKDYDKQLYFNERLRFICVAFV